MIGTGRFIAGLGLVIFGTALMGFGGGLAFALTILDLIVDG